MAQATCPPNALDHTARGWQWAAPTENRNGKNVHKNGEPLRLSHPTTIRSLEPDLPPIHQLASWAVS
jgi:hypothetical protein